MIQLEYVKVTFLVSINKLKLESHFQKQKGSCLENILV